MTNRTITRVFSILKHEIEKLHEPIVGRVARDNDPFKVLVSTMLSLRTKDSTTEQACERLFSAGYTPEAIARMDERAIEKLIFPVGFYKTKARHIKEASRIILNTYKGRVPRDLDKLLALPGVGRKTANLVMILGFDDMGICVDTHVHRITNRWGYLATKSPDETEMRLREILPRRFWKDINNYLVPYGQNICMPVSPWCSRCRIITMCGRVGVRVSR